jgi:hypothetical protein
LKLKEVHFPNLYIQGEDVVAILEAAPNVELLSIGAIGKPNSINQSRYVSYYKCLVSLISEEARV